MPLWLIDIEVLLINYQIFIIYSLNNLFLVIYALQTNFVTCC